MSSKTKHSKIRNTGILFELLTRQITVDVKIESDTSDTETNANVFVIKDAPIPAGGTLVPVGGDQKIVLQATDVLKVQSDTANSADTVLSILEIT